MKKNLMNFKTLFSISCLVHLKLFFFRKLFKWGNKKKKKRKGKRRKHDNDWEINLGSDDKRVGICTMSNLEI